MARNAIQSHGSKRLFLMAIILILLLGACSPDAANSEPTEPEVVDSASPETSLDSPIRIMEWSGYEATEYPQFYAPFTDKYADNLDQVVEYSFFGDDGEAYAKIRSGFNTDLVHPCNSWWGLYVENDLVQPIDTDRLSNWAGVHPELAALGEFDGQQYFVPWEWGYESIIVREDLVPEMPDSWADLWDPQYAGHIAIWDNAETAFVMTALSLGFDPWNTTAEQQEQIQTQLIELKGNLLTYWSDYTESYELPGSGDVWLLANAWQDAFASVQTEGHQVTYLQPAEGRLGWVCGFAITQGAQNLDLIYEFLDAALAPESMAALGNEYWYGFSNLEAIPLVDEYVLEFMNLEAIETLRERTVFYQSLSEDQRQMMSEIWDEVKAAP